MLKYPGRDKTYVKTYWLRDMLFDKMVKAFVETLRMGYPPRKAIGAMLSEMTMIHDYRRDVVYKDGRIENLWPPYGNYPTDLPGIMVDYKLRLIMVKGIRMRPEGPWMDWLLWEKGRRWVRISMGETDSFIMGWPTSRIATWHVYNREYMEIRRWYQKPLHHELKKQTTKTRFKLPEVIII